jgi:uncharacterized membrane protein YhiD involved in acid resistance
MLYMYLISSGIGVTCGSGEWPMAVTGTLSICAVLLVLSYTQYEAGRHYVDYTLTFCVKTPEGAQAFLLAAPRLFAAVTLRSSGQTDAGMFQYVYGVRPRTSTVENAVQVLRKEVEGITDISLVRPEPYNVGVEV